MSYSRTQHSDAGEAGTCGPSVLSQTYAAVRSKAVVLLLLIFCLLLLPLWESVIVLCFVVC